MTPHWDVVEYRGVEGLERLERDWRRLVSAMPGATPHQMYAAHHAFFTHLSRSGGQFTCLALTDGNRVRAICPLERSTNRILGFQTSTWELPWPLWDVGHDVICPADEAERQLLPSVIRFLERSRGGPKWLVCRAVLDNSALQRSLQAIDSGTYATEVVGACDVLDCTSSFERAMARLSSNFRSNLRKAQNKLAALSGVRFASTRNQGELEREFEGFLALEESGWKGDPVVRGALRMRPNFLAFYRELIDSLADLPRLEINALWADGRRIASQVCVRIGETYTVLKMAYDEEYARVAPGQLLLLWELERCCNDPRVNRLSLVTSFPWHRDWRMEGVPARAIYVALGQWTSRPLAALLRLRLKYGPGASRVLRAEPRVAAAREPRPA